MGHYECHSCGSLLLGEVEVCSTCGAKHPAKYIPSAEELEQERLQKEKEELQKIAQEEQEEQEAREGMMSKLLGALLLLVPLCMGLVWFIFYCCFLILVTSPIWGMVWFFYWLLY